MISAEYQREWRKRNPERWREIHRKSNKKHRVKYNSVERAWRASNKEKIKNYSTKRILGTYGITPEDFDRMFAAQEGRCAICFRHQIEFKKRLAVDHCHKTEKVRLLLCGPCNTALGLFQDSPELLRTAADYIKVHQ